MAAYLQKDEIGHKKGWFRRSMKLESVALATLEVGKVAEGRRAVDAVFVDQDLDLASVYDMLSEPGEAESDDGASPHRRSFDGTTTDADADEGIALPRGGINIVFAVSEEGEIVSAVDQQDLLRFTRLVVEDYVETKTPEKSVAAYLRGLRAACCSRFHARLLVRKRLSEVAFRSASGAYHT